MANRVIQTRVSSLRTAGGSWSIPIVVCRWTSIDSKPLLLFLFVSIPSSLILFIEKNSNPQESCKNSTTYTKMNSIYYSARSLILSYLLCPCICVFVLKNVNSKQVLEKYMRNRDYLFIFSDMREFLGRSGFLLSKLDLSLTFDTVDSDILLGLLKTWVGILRQH